MAGRADADGVAEGQLRGAQVEEPLADVDHLVDRDPALPGVAEAHRHVGPHVEAGVARPSYGRARTSRTARRGSVEVALREGLGGAAEDRDVPQALLQRPVEAALVGHQHRQLAGDVPELVDEQSTRSAASASWGTHFGCTKLVDSTTGRPAASSRRTNSALVAVGTGAFSFCSPSRGPTS